MNRTRSILLLTGTDGAERQLLLDDAARLVAGRSARLVVCDTKLRVPPCERYPPGRRTRSIDLVNTVARCADAARAALVVLAIGLQQSEIAIDVGRLSRVCKRDVLVMSRPVTNGPVVAAIDPSAGEAVNAVVLGIALAHSHLHGCELHIVGKTSGPGSCAEIADLLEPICGLDSSRVHAAGGELLQSVGMLAQDAGAGLVVLSKPTSHDDPARISRHILPHSSVLVVHSPSADVGSTSPGAGRRVERRLCQ